MTPRGADPDTHGRAGPTTPTVLDAALARWDPDTDTDPETARAQTRRAAALLATTGERLGRDALADRLADGSTLDAGVWWTDTAGPGLARLADTGLVDDGPDGFRWLGVDVDGTGGMNP